VIAIENVRLFTELGERNRELTAALEQQTATAEILRVISSSPTDLRPVMDAVAENACRVCGAEDAIILRIEGSAVRRVAHFGSLPTRMPELSPIGRDTPYGRAILDQRTLHIEDLQPLLETEYRGVRQFASAVGAGTRLVAPLMREGVPIGAILIRRTAMQPFTDKQIALLESFADQAVIAIENVRLFRELEARNRELSEALERQTATAEILRVISGSPTDVQPVLDVVARNAARLCGARDASVFLREGDVVHAAASVGELAVALGPGNRYPVNRQWVTGRAVVDGVPVQIEDLASAGEDFPEGAAFASRTGHRTTLAVPLLREGEAIGAITIRRGEVRPFTDAHVGLLQTFGAQAVIAIENVRLFTDLRARTGELTRSVQQLTALGEVGQAVGSTLDLETVLATIASRAAQLAGAEACTVSEYDEETEAFTQRTTHNLPAEIAAGSRARPIRKGEGAIGRLPLTHEPEQIADIAEPGAYQGPLRDPLLRAGLRALLALPLLRETHLVGALAVLRRTPGQFPPETVGLLRAFATQSAIAIQNARLFLEIEAKGRQLEVASQHKSQFLANMSHELRTPLNAILGYTELIGDGIYGEVPQRMREVLERVNASGRHLLGLINDILDLSKIEAGQLRLVLGDYAMADVVQSVAASAEPLAAAKSLELAVSMAPDLPAGRGDGRRLTQVLLNLVGNAIKFTDAGRVSLTAEVAGEAFVVSVTDTGPGIAPGEQERIFEEFQQAETTIRRAKGGTGLGLAISRRIVEMHGGRLWVESTVGEGSTFTFTVPIRATARTAMAAPEPAA
jgi:signal transduction histidine kinase